MAGFFRSRPKRVTDPLDDDARARIVGDHSYSSSGSEHSGDGSGQDSPCLSELVHGFLEPGCDFSDPRSTDLESDRVDSAPDLSAAIEEILRASSASNADPYRNLLHAHATLAAEISSDARRVMAALRERGHNAAVCKTKWEASGGLAAGGYEFVDVVRSGLSEDRYVVDVEFRSEFEVARPTSEYSRLLQALPRVFVGRSEDLKRIVRVTCDAARRSMRSRDLSIPPWRKNRYMQQKWLGPYRRTTNLIPATTGAVSTVQCRYVGFDDASNGRVFVRTR